VDNFIWKLARVTRYHFPCHERVADLSQVCHADTSMTF